LTNSAPVTSPDILMRNNGAASNDFNQFERVGDT